MSEDSSNSRGPAMAEPMRAVLLVVASFFGLQALASVLLALLFYVAGMSGVQWDSWLMASAVPVFLYLSLFHVFSYAVLWWYLRYRRLSWRTLLGFRRVQLRDVGYVVAGWFVYFVLFMVISGVLQAVTAIDLEQKQAIGFSPDSNGVGLGLAFVALVIMTPILEELFFRGFLLGTLRRNGFGLWWAAGITSLLFGLMHLQGGVAGALLWIGLVDTFLLSLVLCYVRERSGALWASIGIHAVKNCIAFVALFIFA